MARGGRWIQRAIGRGAGCERIKRRGAGAGSALSCGRRSAACGGRGAAPGGRASAGGGGGSAGLRARGAEAAAAPPSAQEEEEDGAGRPARRSSCRGRTHSFMHEGFFIFLFLRRFFQLLLFLPSYYFSFSFFSSSLSRGVSLSLGTSQLPNPTCTNSLPPTPPPPRVLEPGFSGLRGRATSPLPRSRARWPCPALRDFRRQECRSPETPRAGGTHL